MVRDGTRAAPLTTPPEPENSVPGVVLDTSFYEGRLPIHSSDGSFSTQLFTMDAATGAYTFGYDTGIYYIRFCYSLGGDDAQNADERLLHKT